MDKYGSNTDQLSNIDKFKNTDSKIIICDGSYNKLISMYRADRMTYQNNKDNEVEGLNEIMNMWENDMSKCILICAPTEKTEDSSYKDTGEYSIVVLAPDGRPVQITPPFSKIADYFVIEDGMDKETTPTGLNLDYKYKKLAINFDKLAEHIVNNNKFIELLKEKLNP